MAEPTAGRLTANTSSIKGWLVMGADMGSTRSSTHSIADMSTDT